MASFANRPLVTSGRETSQDPAAQTDECGSPTQGHRRASPTRFRPCSPPALPVLWLIPRPALRARASSLLPAPTARCPPRPGGHAPRLQRQHMLLPARPPTRLADAVTPPRPHRTPSPRCPQCPGGPAAPQDRPPLAQPGLLHPRLQPGTETARRPLPLPVTAIDSPRRLVHGHRGQGAPARDGPLPQETLALLRAYWHTHRNTTWRYPATGRDQKPCPRATSPMRRHSGQGAFRQATRRASSPQTDRASPARSPSSAPPRRAAGVTLRLRPRSRGPPQLDTPMVSLPRPHTGHAEASQRLTSLRHGLLTGAPARLAGAPLLPRTLHALLPSPPLSGVGF
jgi:hypothetical protein